MDRTELARDVVVVDDERSRIECSPRSLSLCFDGMQLNCAQLCAGESANDPFCSSVRMLSTLTLTLVQLLLSSRTKPSLAFFAAQVPSSYDWRDDQHDTAQLPFVVSRANFRERTRRSARRVNEESNLRDTPSRLRLAKSNAPETRSSRLGSDASER